MIVDAFLFYNELELLELRLHELKDVIDCFVLVESPVTFSGKPKPLFYEENKAAFKKFPIHHVIVPENKDITDSWQREAYQRNNIARGLVGLDLSSNDTILVSDVDEIPRAKVIPELTDWLKTVVSVGLHQPTYYYYFNLLSSLYWVGTKAVRYSNYTCAETIRKSCEIVLYKAGWHFSFIGNTNKIAEKIQAYSHTEHANTTARDIKQALKERRGLFGDKESYRVVPVDDTFPTHLKNRKYSKYILKENDL